VDRFSCSVTIIHQVTRTNTKHDCRCRVTFRNNHWQRRRGLINSASQVCSKARAQFLMASLCLLLFTSTVMTQTRPARLAVLDFGKDATGLRAAVVLRETLHTKEEVPEFTVIDRDQTSAAAVGAGFEGSLNLTTQQARDLGAAMGCDFFFSVKPRRSEESHRPSLPITNPMRRFFWSAPAPAGWSSGRDQRSSAICPK